MAQDHDPDALVGALADNELLEPGATNLPLAVGRPETLPATRWRGPIVAAGVALTGLTLIGGIALFLLGVLRAFSDGADLFDGALVAIGLLLTATHWGWVHVAELSANQISARESREIVDRRDQWLETIAPYTREEVVTRVEEDGSIAILRQRYRPVTTSDDRFTFVREVVDREVHSEDEPSAEVTERAEQLRREASLVTAQARERYLTAADKLQTALLHDEDRLERLHTRRANAQALSERINTHLQSPPLDE
jgi:hypothetical protein